MLPANLPDLRAVQELTKTERSFFLNIQSSESSRVLYSYPGTFNSATGQYSFGFELLPTFDSVGTHVITFFYKTSSGFSIPLKLFDSETNYLFDVGQTFSYNIDTKLSVVEDTFTKTDKLEYGNNVAFTFKVVDEVSKKNVWNGLGDATGYLLLRHDVGNKGGFTSIKYSVPQVEKNGKPSHFAVDWSVNPNAFNGLATLSLVAQSSNGDLITLTKAGKPWSVDVTIGGSIDVTKKSHSAELGLSNLVSFFVEFELACNQKILKGADLFASIKFPKTEETLQIPVGVGSQGQYQVSWVLKNKRAPGGEYKIDIFRQVDTKRNATVEPFVRISHTHSPPEGQPFPIRTEVLVFLIFLGSFIWASYKKTEISALKKV